MASVTIVVGARANVDSGFARVRTAARNMTNSLRDNFGAAGRASGQSFSQRLLNVVNQGIGSMFQAGQGLGQSLGRGLSVAGSNPYVAAGIAALVAVVAPAIGAALAGAIVLAFGGAFVGLGAFLLKDNEQVKSAWGKTIGDLKKKFTEAAKPLIPVLTHAADMVGKLGDKFAPHFEKAMQAAAPHLTKFLDSMGRGIELFGKKAFKPMMDAFNGLLDEIDMESFFGSLGDAFKYLADAVLDNKKEIGLLFNIILGTIPIAIRIIGFLAQMWGQNVRQVAQVIKWVRIAVEWIAKMKGKAIKFLQRGAEDIREKVRSVINWVKNMKGKAIKFLESGATAIRNKVRDVINWVKNLKGKSIRFLATGINAIISAIRRVKGWISGLKGKTIHIGATVSGAVKRFFGFASGGIVGRAAEGGPRNNLTMVGEHGPELVDLAPGSRVRSNPDTRRFMAASGGGGRTVLELRSSGAPVDDMLLELLRKAIRVRGGNVQLVLGR